MAGQLSLVWIVKTRHALSLLGKYKMIKLGMMQNLLTGKIRLV